MDGRINRRWLWEIISISVLVISLYAYLVHKDTPGLTLLEFIKGGVKLALLMFGKINDRVLIVFFDLSFFLVIFLASLAFVAQFTLPVRNFVQRFLAFGYLGLFTVGLHGPRVVIENGTVPEHYPKEKPSSFNVILMDTASAGVLRTPVEFTRSIGPGLVFTRSKEYLAGTVDLHRKAWPEPPFGFGPRGDEDPFEPFDEKKEAKDAFEQRQKRRYETSCETRDGVEVVPNIFVLSQINSELKVKGPPWNSPRSRLVGWLMHYLESATVTRLILKASTSRLIARRCDWRSQGRRLTHAYR